MCKHMGGACTLFDYRDCSVDQLMSKVLDPDPDRDPDPDPGRTMTAASYSSWLCCRSRHASSLVLAKKLGVSLELPPSLSMLARGRRRPRSPAVSDPLLAPPSGRTGSM